MEVEEMEPVVRRIEELTDGLGRVRRSLLRTVAVRDQKELDVLLKRLDEEQKLIGCEGAVCHLEYWTDQTADGWNVTIRSRVLTSLRTHLAKRAMEQEELIVLPADPRKAELALRLFRQSTILPDQDLKGLALNVCRGLEMAQKVGLQQCPVSMDSIYITDDGRWLLGDFFLPAEENAGTEGLALVLHQLLGGQPQNPEPPYGGTDLCLLVRQLRNEPMEPAALREKLEKMMGLAAEKKPEPAVKRKELPAQVIRPETEKKEPPVQVPHPVVEKKEPVKPVQAWQDHEKKAPLPERNHHAWQTAQEEKPPVQSAVKKPTIEDIIRKKVNLSCMISAGDGFTAAVRRNGTVQSTRIFAGLASWTGIKAVAVGGSHMLGLREDGRLRVTGNNFHGQCDVSTWENIVQIAAGMSYSAGLTADGRLMIAGWVGDKWKQSGQWTNLAAIAAGSQHVVGLRKDGTVIADGHSLQGQCDVAQWKDIVAVSAGGIHTVGLKGDGTVVATGANLFGQCAVESWTDIIAVDAGADHTVGLKADGTVVATGNFSFGARNVSEWKNVIAISAGWSITVGLTADGQLLATGKNDYGQCDIAHWHGMV